MYETTDRLGGHLQGSGRSDPPEDHEPAQVERAIGLSQAAVSHHMAILIREDLVQAEKRGRWMYYRRNEARLARLAEAVKMAV